MSMIPKNHAHVLYAIMLMIFEIMSMILKLLALGILRNAFTEVLFRTISNRLFLALSNQFEWSLLVMKESIE